MIPGTNGGLVEAAVNWVIGGMHKRSDMGHSPMFGQTFRHLQSSKGVVVLCFNAAGGPRQQQQHWW